MIAFLSVLNLGFTDVLAAIVPLGCAFWLVLTNINAGREKYKVGEAEATNRHRFTIEAEAEKERRKIEAEVEKEKIVRQAEVEKARERSVGGEAVAMIFKELHKVQEEIKRLTDAQTTDHSNDVILREIIKRLQEDVNRLMTALFENLINK